MIRLVGIEWRQYHVQVKFSSAMWMSGALAGECFAKTYVFMVWKALCRWHQGISASVPAASGLLTHMVALTARQVQPGCAGRGGPAHAAGPQDGRVPAGPARVEDAHRQHGPGLQRRDPDHHRHAVCAEHLLPPAREASPGAGLQGAVHVSQMYLACLPGRAAVHQFTSVQHHTRVLHSHNLVAEPGHRTFGPTPLTVSSMQWQADQKKAKFFQPEGDHLTLLAVYEAWKASKFSKPWAYENFIQERSLRRAQVRRQAFHKILQASMRMLLALRTLGAQHDVLRCGRMCESSS